MQRPALDTLACVNPECPWFRLTGQDNLTVRKVYGHDHIRLLCCRTYGEECSERRGTALCNTKLLEEQAASVSNLLGKECGVRACCGWPDVTPSGAMTNGCAASRPRPWPATSPGAS